MIIVVSEIYYPEEVSTGFILTKIAEGLAQNYPVEVVTGPPDYSGEKIVPDFEVHNKVKINRVKVKSLNKNKLSARLIRSILLSLKLAWKTIKLAKKGDTIFIVTNPAPLLMLMTFISRLTRTKLVVLVHDVFPENLHAANIVKKDTLFFNILLKVFNTVYRKASHIVVIGRDMDKVIRNKIKGPYPKTSMITNWADVHDIFPAERSKNNLIQKLKIENKFIVQFAGNLGRVQGVDQMVDAAEILKDTNVQVLFIGDGARKNWILEQIKERNLKNIISLPFISRSEQQDFLNACDVGLISLAPGMTGLGVPSKTYNILAAGKPVIAIVDQDSEIGMLITEKNIGWVVNPGDSKGLAQVIKEASESKNLAEMSKRARAVAESEYSLESIINQYNKVFKEITH